MSEVEFEAVRREGDPVAQARRATELITLYQQRGVELARLRREAINRAVRETGMTYTQVAHELGLSKGRVSQIRSSAPAAERELFGVGPLTLAMPTRLLGGRPQPVVAVEDATAAEHMTALLESLAFVVTPYRIPANGEWEPPADAVAICGPKSSHVTAEAIASDPHLTFEEDAQGRWPLLGPDGTAFTSPMDLGDPDSDYAYVGRLPYRGRSIFVIAGIHAQGSVGAVDYLAQHAAELHQAVGGEHFSMVVSSRFDNGTTTATETVWGPETF